MNAINTCTTVSETDTTVGRSVVAIPDQRNSHVYHEGLCGSHVQDLEKSRRIGRPRKPVVEPSSPSELDLGPRWYVAVTHMQAELWALQNLARQGVDCYLPMIEEEIRDRVTPTMRRIIQVPLWLGYVLVRFDRLNDPWRPIAHTQGVRELLGQHPERPSPLPIGFVEALQELADNRRIIRTPPPVIAAGSEVFIKDGPFADHRGVCLWSNATRIRIAAEFFGAVRNITVSRKVASVVEK